MLKTYKRILQAAVAGVLALVTADSVLAVGTAKIYINGVLKATDDGAGDTSPSAGSVGFSTFGVVPGYSFSLTTSTGTSNLNGGSATNPYMDLLISATRDSTGPSTMTIDFIDTGWTTTLQTLLAAFTTDDHGPSSNVTFQTYLNTSGTLGGTLLTSQNSLTNSTDLFTTSSPGVLTGAGYTLDLRFIITGGISETFTVKGVVQPTSDGGFTLVLLGGAMMGLGALHRKVKTA